MGSIDEKNQRIKISCYCPFKGVPKILSGQVLLQVLDETNLPHLLITDTEQQIDQEYGVP